MGGTTTPVALPYPTGTDRVADGDNAIQALAEAVDNYFVGVESVILYSSGVVDNAGDPSRLFQRGRSVHLYFNLMLNVAAGAGTVLCAVPDVYRPASDWRFFAWEPNAGGAAIRAMTMLRASGNIYCEAALASGSILAGSVSYPLPLA